MAEESKSRRTTASSRKASAAKPKATSARKPAAKKAAGTAKSTVKKTAGAAKSTASAARKTAGAATKKTAGAAKSTAGAARKTAKAATKKAPGAAKKPARKPSPAAKPSAKPAAKASAEKRPVAPSRPPVNIQPVAAASGAESPKEKPTNGGPSAETKAERRAKGELPPASEIPAPSIGPHTVIEKEPPEKRMARGQPSETDAMGLDKRRAVIGGQYSPSLAKQATLYGIAIAVILALGIGGFLLAKELDQPPEQYADEAPWSRSDAGNQPPTPLQ